MTFLLKKIKKVNIMNKEMRSLRKNKSFKDLEVNKSIYSL